MTSGDGSDCIAARVADFSGDSRSCWRTSGQTKLFGKRQASSAPFALSFSAIVLEKLKQAVAFWNWTLLLAMISHLG